MKLIKSYDGLVSWQIGNKVIPCQSHMELFNIGWGHIAQSVDPEGFNSFCNEVTHALDIMSEHDHYIGHFSESGSFMFSVIDDSVNF